jgi:hypothetical protein
MSGAFSGDGVPPGVAADAFYEKGTGVGSLLQIVKTMTEMKRPLSFQRRNTLAPIWIPRNGHDPSGEEYVMITCPECMRSFPQVFGNGIHTICEADCVYCHSLIHYAIVQPTDPATPQTFQRKPRTGTPTSLGSPISARGEEEALLSSRSWMSKSRWMDAATKTHATRIVAISADLAKWTFILSWSERDALRRLAQLVL